jgi:hypothetical protein
MSITIDYFFNYSNDFPELTRNINAWLGSSLAPYEGDAEDLFCRFLPMEFSLSTHDLENDDELDFENYKYELGFRVPAPDADLRTIQLPAITLVAYTLYRQMKITGMLVYDAQTLLARYEERVEPENNTLEIYDIVSGEFASFPKHFETLQKRLPKAAC